MKLTLPTLGLLLALGATAHAGFTIAKRGKASCSILQQPNATLVESNAVRELATTLEQVTRATFKVVNAENVFSDAAIIVGPGDAAKALFPEVNLDQFGAEEFVMRVKSNHLLLAGGRPRGTLYAINHFLQEQCGVRWWTPWATNIPPRVTLRIPELNVRAKPAFEYREPYWFQGFDPLWKARNGANGESHRIPSELGGSIIYKGFCHTFYPLVPPEKYFTAHPEWYSLLKGRRTHDHGQLCLSNPGLRDFMVGRVKEWLRESPDASIISVTQNDWFGACECASCKTIDDAEGSPSGSMLAFLNYIAEKIEPEFPDVAVDTFAYQYTRKPPKTIKPRPNVIVRLCSIECNFREPLDHPSNAAFLADLEGWSKICQRLYIWDYTTDFKNYVNPHPNWFTLGPNVRLFQKYGVRGVFEQGAYAGYGSELGELRAWVLAQLLWNPQQDDHALINEFLKGYYGEAAAKPIRRYLGLMQESSKGFYLGCYLRKEPAHLHFQALAKAERLWQHAEAAVAGNAELLARVRVSHLPVQYAFLSQWYALRREGWEQNGDWPMPESRKALADEFGKVCQGVAGKPWTEVRVLNERGLQVEEFLKAFAEDPPNTNGPAPPKRLRNPPPPPDVPGANTRACVDLQDNHAALARPGEWAEIRPDHAASDRRAVWMPGNHSEWAFRISGDKLPPRAQSGKWKVYAIVRVETNPGEPASGVAFGAGVYDTQSKTCLADFKEQLDGVSANYRAYLLGTVEMNPHRDIYVAPAGNKSVKAIYVDRIFLVPAR